MDEGVQLQSIRQRRNRATSKGAQRLGEVLGEVMDRRISPRQARFGPVAEFWNEVLPVELGRHCKIAGVSGGQLKVVVDSPSFMHELRLCSSELLEELRQRCPRARIEKIKIVAG